MSSSPSPNDPDEALVALIKRGDERAFTEMARRHAGRLKTLVWRYSGQSTEADDIVQETLLTAWRSAERWHPGGPPFGAWLTRIALNRAIDAERRKKIRRFFGLEAAAEMRDGEPTAEDRIMVSSELNAVLDDIGRLPSRQRAAILLATNGQGTDEIAATMGISAGAAEQLLVRARRNLRSSMIGRTMQEESQ